MLIPGAAVDFSIPSGRALPGRGEGEESFSVFRIARQLGPGQALTRVGAVLLRGHGHADHFPTGRCHAKRGGASEQKCTLHTGCIERCPSEIAPRWAPLSCWRGRPGARRVAVTGESILACRPGGAELSSAISRSLPAGCLPARSPIPMLSTTAGTSSGRWRLRDRFRRQELASMAVG